MRVGEQRACLMCWEQVHQPGSSLNCFPGRLWLGDARTAWQLQVHGARPGLGHTSAAHPWVSDTCSAHWKGWGWPALRPSVRGTCHHPTPPSLHTLPAHTDQHSLHTWAITSLGSALQKVGSNHVASLNRSFFASLCEGQMSDT